MTADRIAGYVERLRRPEYTGPNRCLPCTVVNLALAAGLTVAVALLSPVVALAVGALSLASIAFRGYLVPGTPELTKRYLPERVLAWFGKAPEPIQASGVDPGALLTDAGVVVDPDGADLELDDGFAAVWTARTRELIDGEDSERRALADLLGVPPDEIAITAYDEGLTASLGDQWLGSWESPAAFFADMAAMDLLPERVPEWDRLTMAARSEVVGALRLFAESCPECAQAIELREGTVESCCSTRPVVAATCVGCGARLVEMPVDRSMLDSDEPAVR